MQKWIARIALFGLLFCSAFTAHAQDAASMAGTVTDVSGAVLPGTTVTISNPRTGVSYKQTSDKIGYYHFLNVPPGEGYNIEFVHDGFASSTVKNVTLNVGQTRTQDSKLTVGSAVAIEVEGGDSNVTVNTTDATIGNNIDVHQLNDLPIYDRTAGISTLFYQQPGVDSATGSVTGARVDQSEVTVDGMDVNDVASGQTFGIIAQAPVDSVEQFTGSVAGLQSPIGTGSGGQFQLVTKSGTNKFHGNLNEYHRDTTTVANTYFNNLTGLRRTPLIRNQFGGNIGGPILKDKLFFFTDIAASRIIQSATSEPTVPLDSFRNGTLNYINSNAGCGDSSRITTQPTCITNLSGAQVAALDPAGIGFNANVLSFINSRYPHANDLSRGDGVNTGGYRFTTPTPDIETTYVARVDYNMTKTQKVFARATIQRRNAIETLPEFNTDPLTHPFTDQSYGYVISHVWQLGTNKVNQFYYGDTITKFSFPDLYNPTGVNQYAFSGLSGPYTAYDGQQRRVPLPEVRDDFNWQLGRHSIVAGGTFKFIKTNSLLVNNFNFTTIGLGGATSGGLDATVRPADINQGANAVGVNDFDNLFTTGLGTIGAISTNYVYNNAGAAQPLGTGAPRSYRFYQTEAYVGDTWKVTPKLTLSYGLRYQFYTVPYETHGDESISTPISLNDFVNARLKQQNSGNTSPTGLPFYQFILAGKANNGPDLYQPSYKDFAPRVAANYAITDKTVISASAGLLYDRSVINSVNFLQDQVPNLFANTNQNLFGAATVHDSFLPYPTGDPRVGANLAYSAALNPAPTPTTSPYTPYVDSTGFASGLAQGETNFIVSQNLKDPYNIVYSAGLQQEFPGHTIMRLNYSGRLGRRLLADADANQVINMPDTTGKSTQTLSQAFAGMTAQLRAGVSTRNLTAQPWFEDVLGPGFAGIRGNNTRLVAAMIGQLGNRGDISDALQTVALYSDFYGYDGFLPQNVGIPSQFGTNAYLTNMGSSNYNAMLLTISHKAHGLSFDMNYTWAHSIDNTSLSSANNALYNNSGFICDILSPRACRGSSDFDTRQQINSNFVYDLPFGRGRSFAANAPRWLDEAIGGWSFSGLPSWRTGLPVTAYSDAYLASFDNQDPAIFTGNPQDLHSSVNVNHASNTVYGFAGGVAGANKVLSEFRGPLGLEYGQRNLLRGPLFVNLDAGLAKRFAIIQDKGIDLQFRADAFNVLNHPSFGTPNVNIVTNASNFGQVTGTASGSRVGQFSLRLEF